MPLDLTVVDSFTDRPFAGNPAAVAVVDRFPDDAEMQLVAREMNLSETAFVVPRSDGDYDLRWFTPAVEVDLCGHATLATAHVLGGAGRFMTRSGVLTCTHRGRRLDRDGLPGRPAGGGRRRRPTLGIDGIRWCGRGRSDLLIELADAGTVRALQPDLAAVAALGVRLSDRDGRRATGRASTA